MYYTQNVIGLNFTAALFFGCLFYTKWRALLGFLSLQWHFFKEPDLGLKLTIQELKKTHSIKISPIIGRHMFMHLEHSSVLTYCLIGQPTKTMPNMSFQGRWLSLNRSYLKPLIEITKELVILNSLKAYWIVLFILNVCVCVFFSYFRQQKPSDGIFINVFSIS